MGAYRRIHDRVNMVLHPLTTHKHDTCHKKKISHDSKQARRVKMRVTYKYCYITKWNGTYLPCLESVDPKNFLFLEDPLALPIKQPQIILPCKRTKASSPPNLCRSSSQMIPWWTASTCPSHLSTWNTTWITSRPSGPRCTSLWHSNTKYLCLNIEPYISNTVTYIKFITWLTCKTPATTPTLFDQPCCWLCSHSNARNLSLLMTMQSSYHIK